MTPDEALERCREAGIRRLQIPTPFAVGKVNCYLLEDDPLTLIDTGPNSGRSLDELQRQLGEIGLSIDDLELVVITHQHLDHLGLIEIIVEHSGATLAALDAVVPFIESYWDDAERDDEFAASIMRRYGIPDDMVTALRSVSASFRAWGSAAKVTQPLADGSTITFRDRDLQVQHRPGHSPSDTCLWDADRSILFAGDHLIGHISSNPLLSRPLDGSSERPRALMTYLDSLARTRALPAQILLPGHGEPVTDHVAVIDDRFAMHRRRAAKLAGLIAERPRTAYELAQELWGNVAVTQAFLTISEVVGHVDLLVEAGVVREVGEGDVIVFEATGEPGEVTIPP